MAKNKCYPKELYDAISEFVEANIELSRTEHNCLAHDSKGACNELVPLSDRLKKSRKVFGVVLEKCFPKK